MKFLTTNLCSDSDTVITASSSNVNFPASNLKNPFRSKRWRSSGTFIVDSTNNKINFQEVNAGTQYSATVTSGTYTPTTLAAEIKTQMELVGANNYTVTYSATTGLWTVVSDGSYFNLMNQSGANAATAIFKVSLGFPNADQDANVSKTGTTVAIHTQETIVFDMLTSEDIDSIVLLWSVEDGIRLSNNAVIKIQANATNVWTSPAVNQTLTVNNTYMRASHFFTSVQSYRYWRILIQDPSNPYLYIELGVPWIGGSLDFDEPENGFKFGLSDSSDVQRTDFGQEYIDEYPQIAALEFDCKLVDYPTAQILENAYRSNGNRLPVMVVFDDQETVFDKDHFSIYGKMGKSFGLDHVSYDLFNTAFKIMELT